jgi:hypothetical protein
MRNHRHNQRFGKIIESGPQEHDIEHPTGKIQRLVQKPLYIPDGLIILICPDLPVAAACVWHQIREEDAVAQFGEVIDI